MNAIELVDTLQQQGFTLTLLSEGKLAVKPADRITDELRQHIRQCKAEVLALLVSRRSASSDQGSTHGTTMEPVTFWTDSRDIDPENPPVPYINARGELIVPFECAPKYRWWAGGQSIHQTLRELNAPPEVIGRYVDSGATLRRMQ